MNPILALHVGHAETDVSSARDVALPQPAPLAHLFRASLSEGRMHPLYVPMQQYRSTRAAIAG